MPLQLRVRQDDVIHCKKEGGTNTLKHVAQYEFVRDNTVCEACTYRSACRQIANADKADREFRAEM
ncbi:MAG: hypothetical protein ABI747_04500 [Candidatus Moraniibacteriota bacterium]